ncbi:MAG TPA: hypothetical protein VF862_02590 [Gemmatimonadales bacterium]
MSVLFPITQAERAGWQRRAAAVLAAILDTHRDLPVIVWTVGPAGSMLSGRVAGPGSEAEMRAVFHDWRSALCLAEHSETVGGSGICYLRAVGRRERVRLALTATVFDDDVVEQV